MNIPKMPIGESNFQVLRQNPQEWFYVDKSGLVRDLLKEESKVLLITRPRRFGKTLNLSMLQCFFAQENAIENRELFRDLSIFSDDEIMSAQGTRPVIFLTFKECRDDNWDSVLEQIKLLIGDCFDQHQEAFCSLELKSSEKRIRAAFMSGDYSVAVLRRSLLYFSRWLEKSTGVKPLILIDEYDVPLQSAWTGGFWNKAVNFMRGLFSAVLKDNASIWKAVLGGCLRISKESLFTGLNNLSIYSVTENPYSEYFGLTVPEVKKILAQYHLEDKASEVEDWYNGYNFGGTVIYNPWSLLNWVKEGGESFKPHWANSSDNELVHYIFRKSGVQVKSDLNLLLGGESIEVPLHEHVVFQDIEKSATNIWNFLFSTGYLMSESVRTSVEGEMFVSLKIPNMEIKTIFRDSVRRWFDETESGFILQNSLQKSLKEGNGDEFERLFSTLIKNSFSYFDVQGKNPENFYYAFVLGLIVYMSDFWLIRSNRESGDGRADILMFPKNPEEYCGVIIELKKEEVKTALVKKAKAALLQIENKNYVAELRAAGAEKILKVGIAFCGKNVGLCCST
jgi:hypothetical protein